MRIVPKSAHKPAAELPPIVVPRLESDALRVLLVKPAFEDKAVGFNSCLPPLDLLTTAAAVPPEHRTWIVDMRLEDDADFERCVREIDPHVLGVTCYSAESESAKRLLRRAKAANPGLVTLQGGYHAAMAPEDALDEPALDFLVMGEAETTLPRLLEALADGHGFESVRGLAYRSAGEVAFTPPEERIQDLDTLPLPDWSLLARYQDRYHLHPLGRCGSVETTRGCPFDCSFCSVWVFNSRTYRRKSPARVLEEIDRLPDGLKVVMFVDDEFWVDDDRSFALADLLLGQPEGWPRRGLHYWAQVRTSDVRRRPELVEVWARAGLRVLLLGIESVKDSELEDLHHKRNKVANSVFALETMHRHGVEAWGAFIVNPEWQEEDFAELASFVREHEVAFPQFTILTPLPGTPLMDRVIAEGALDPETLPPQLLDFLHTTLPTRLPLDRFYEQVAALYRNSGVHSSLKIYKRLMRNGLVSKQWMTGEMSDLIRRFYEVLGDPESYLDAHRKLGHDLGRQYGTAGAQAIS
jgi:radical SAM superfamily enzyme YgiQ (UPF0313 family)